MTTEEILGKLNDEQKKAVLINSGSLLIFAGAGSGKTRVLTSKIAYSVLENLARPYEILAVTFTNKACNEMRERVCAMIGNELSGSVMIKTFHSFGVWLLRRYCVEADLKPGFTIYDESDSRTIMAKCFPNRPRKETDVLTSAVLHYKEVMKVPSFDNPELLMCYNAYNKALKESCCIDFPDMILKSIELLKKNEDVRNYVHKRFKMILVDEYQDSNAAQFTLLKMLCHRDNFVCVVGDDDQSIYRFRGAEIGNIINFSNQFSNTETVFLNTNYRCPSAVLDAANDVICHNKSRVKKELKAEKKEGRKPLLIRAESESEEARKICSIIKTFSPDQMNDTAVLYRTNAQSRSFERRFLNEGIPYRLVGSLRFYEREEVKDGIALLRLLVNPFDAVSFVRMINKPARGIGESTVQAFAEGGGNLIEKCKEALISGSLKPRVKSGVSDFCTAYDAASDSLNEISNDRLLYNMLKDFGLIDYYKKRDDEEQTGERERLENLSNLVSDLSSEGFSNGAEGLMAFLENAGLDSASLGKNAQNDDTGVTLITMHNTKGLEFNNVFVSGMENEIFPGSQTLDSGDPMDLEEERRICYVAFTRAKERLYLSFAERRQIWGRITYHTPSLFLREIKSDHIEDPSHSLRSGSGNTGLLYTQFKKPDRIGSFEKPNKTESVYSEGDRVHSDILGNGTVRRIHKIGGREIMMVQFENGRIATFIAGSANLIKL